MGTLSLHRSDWSDSMPVCPSCNYKEDYNFCRMCGTQVRHTFANQEDQPFYPLKDRIITDDNEPKHQAILSHTYDLVCAITEDGIYEYASPSYAKTLGVYPDELIGQHVLINAYPEDKHIISTTLANMSKTKDASTFEYRKFHVNGTIVLLECKGAPIITSTGEIEGFVFVSRDVTEKRQAEKKIRNSEKLSVIGHLAASIAHEVRNPLTTIKGFVQLFSETQQPKKTMIYRDLIQHELSQIEHIITEFMSLAKQEYVYTDNLVITDLLDEVLKQFEPVTGVKNIRIFRHYPKEHPLLVSGQKTQLTQVFIHIIQNAIDSMESGGKLAVSIEKSARETLCIVIKDNGCGIDSKRIPHIGEPFYTTKERGIGLGLTICNKIINEHNGFFHVSSEKNDGTSITITLPMKTTELYVVEA